MGGLQILAALFIDDIDVRPVDGPSTRIDLGGVQFSAPPPSADSFRWEPHLAVIVRASASDDGAGVLEAVFTIDDEQVARNVQPLQVDPGKFGYRLVRAEIDVPRTPITIEARVRVDQDDALVVPYTFLAALPDAAPTEPTG